MTDDLQSIAIILLATAQLIQMFRTRYRCKACKDHQWNYYLDGCAAPCHVCRASDHINLFGKVVEK